MKNLTIKQIIDILLEQGHTLKFYKRPDGGYVIQSINGTRYQGKQGNAVARTMVGATLSEARQYQLGRIRTPKGKKRSPKKKTLSKSVVAKLRKVQRKHREKHPTAQGGITLSNIRYQVEHYGEESALETLERRLLYEEGIAYPENVRYLLDRLSSDLAKSPNDAMEQAFYRIERHYYNNSFKEDWIYPTYEAIYDWEEGRISGEEASQKIRALIG